MKLFGLSFLHHIRSPWLNLGRDTVMAAVTLNLIAKQAPQPVGLAALAYSLPPAQITLNYVHSLPAEAPKGENCSVEINGSVVSSEFVVSPAVPS